MKNSPTDRQTLQKLGLAIRELREKRGWSQEELAYQSGLHRTYIGAVERAERNITVLNLQKIARALDATMRDLFRGL